MGKKSNFMTKSIGLGVVLSSLALIGCDGGDTQSPPVNNTVNRVSIDEMTSVPVMNGSSTKGTLYIHNYGDKDATGLVFTVEQPTVKSKLYNLLASAGLSVNGLQVDVHGFSLSNVNCSSIPAGGSCAINFNTPNLAPNDMGSSSVSLRYKTDGKDLVTKQIVNYEYRDVSSYSGVSFTGGLRVASKQGETRHVVGYLYAGGEPGAKYKDVNLSSSSPNVKTTGGFINGQELAAGQVIPVEFSVALQSSNANAVNVVPTYMSQVSSNNLAALKSNGGALVLKTEPSQNVVNYLFGMVPILNAPTTTPASVLVTNNGDIASNGSLTVNTGSPYLVATNNCAGVSLSANAADSCNVQFSVESYSPGQSTVTYSYDGVPVGTQQIIWNNKKDVPLVYLVPSPVSTSFNQESSSGLVTFTVNNAGGAPFDVTSFNPKNNNSSLATWAQESTNCGSTILPQGQCTITGKLTNSTSGSASSASSTFYYSALGGYLSNSYTFASLPLSYTVIGALSLSISPSVPSMRILADGIESKQITYTITNNGGTPATLGSFVLTESGNMSVYPAINTGPSAGSCVTGNILAVGNTCTIIATFGPAPVSVADSESGTSTITVNYTGTAGSGNSVNTTPIYITGAGDGLTESTSENGMNEGSGTEEDPYMATPGEAPQSVEYEYKNDSEFPMEYFNINVNELPYGMTVDEKNTTCAFGANTGTIAVGASCKLVLLVDPEKLANSPQGGMTEIQIDPPEASWQNPIGFYKKPGVTTTFINYLQPTITFVVSNNNSMFESTVLTMTATNESTVSALSGRVSQVMGQWLPAGSIVNPSSNCTIDQSATTGAKKPNEVTCNLKTSPTGRVTYMMQNWLTPDDNADLPLVFSVIPGQFAYLSPAYIFVSLVQGQP